MSKKYKKRIDNLGRLMSYMLGNRPDEFGLLPDSEGYVAVKEFLKAIKEEPQMGYVRESHIKEVLIHDREKRFEISGNMIRSIEREYGPINRQQVQPDPPGLLFKGVKRKAYPHILKKGLMPAKREYVVMTEDKELAMKMGRRLDQKPVLLEISTFPATKNGVDFYPFGENLYLADSVPVGFINGPPLPQEDPSGGRTAKKDKAPGQRDKMPGSFILRPDKDPDAKRRNKSKKKTGWKERARKERKRKNKDPLRDWTKGCFE